MLPDPRRSRELLRSLHRPDEARSERIRAEHRAERQGWRSALRRLQGVAVRCQEQPDGPPVIRPQGRRSLEVPALSLGALSRWALRQFASSFASTAVQREGRPACVIAALPPGRLRAVAARHLRRFDHLGPGEHHPWSIRKIHTMSPRLRRRLRRYLAVAPFAWDERIAMLREFSQDPSLRALFNERLAGAHRPPDATLRWHPWIAHLFRSEPDDLGVSPPRLLGSEEARALLPWHASPPEYELFDRLSSACHRSRTVSLSRPALVRRVSAPDRGPARVHRRFDRGVYRGRPGTVRDPRRHPEWWAVLWIFFECWRAGIRPPAHLRAATAFLGDQSEHCA